MDPTDKAGEPETIVEEQANADGVEDQLFDSLEDAADALEDDEEADDEQPDEEEVADSEADDSVLVTLDSGETATLKELKDSWFRTKDYTHKTTEVAQERKAVEAIKATLAEREAVLENALQNLDGFLQNIVPPEPSLQDVYANPTEAFKKSKVRADAIAELQAVLHMKRQIEEARDKVSEAEMREFRNRETAALVKAMPALADPVKKAAFDGSVKASAKVFGFTDDEVAATVDHRILQVVHYARIGLRAEENRKNAGRRVETPKLAKAKPAVAPVNVDNKKAMHALIKSGSRKDALRVDFD